MSEPRVEDVWSKRERPGRLSPEPLLRFVADLPCREAAEALGVNPGTMVKWRSGVGNGVFVDYSVAGNRHTITTTNSVPSPVVNNTITSPLFDVNAKYTHFVVRISSNVMTLYINSVSYGSVNLASRWNTNLGLRIGTEGSDYMSGLIPYIKFYNRALSAAEIAQNFNFYRTRYGI